MAPGRESARFDCEAARECLADRAGLLCFAEQARMMSREPVQDVQAAGTGIDFLQQPGRTSANFGGTPRSLKSSIRIQADLDGPPRTQYQTAVNRKVVGSSPTSGAIAFQAAESLSRTEPTDPRETL
jgi:hypothetical protein